MALFEAPKHAGGFLYRWTRPTASIRECFRAGGGMGAAAVSVSADCFPLMHKYVLTLAPYKADFIKKGYVYTQSTDPPVMQLMEHGHGGHCELLITGAIKTPEASKAFMEFMNLLKKVAIEGHFGTTYIWGDKDHDLFGPATSNYHLWLRKVNKTFAPRGVSEPDKYISARE